MFRVPLRFAIALALPLVLVRAGSAGVLNADVVFANDANQLDTQMRIAYDGANYWTVSGGSSYGVRQAQYTATGSLVGDYAPGLDFRSDFTDAAGNLYARAFAGSVIYKQTSSGVFTPYVTLTGGSLNAQSAVVLNGAGTEYIAFNAGTLSRWDLAGNALPSVTFAGYGSMGTEGDYPQNRAVAAVDGVYLTYTDGVLSTWSQSGVRVDTNTLASAGQTFDSYFSFSYADDRVWVVDVRGGDWRGYLYSPTVVPEPSSLVLAVVGGLATATLGRRSTRRRDIA